MLYYRVQQLTRRKSATDLHWYNRSGFFRSNGHSGLMRDASPDQMVNEVGPGFSENSPKRLRSEHLSWVHWPTSVCMKRMFADIPFSLRAVVAVFAAASVLLL
jgi:hypothetical protein